MNSQSKALPRRPAGRRSDADPLTSPPVVNRRSLSKSLQRMKATKKLISYLDAVQTRVVWLRPRERDGHTLDGTIRSLVQVERREYGTVPTEVRVQVVVPNLGCGLAAEDSLRGGRGKGRGHNRGDGKFPDVSRIGTCRRGRGTTRQRAARGRTGERGACIIAPVRAWCAGFTRIQHGTYGLRDHIPRGESMRLDLIHQGELLPCRPALWM